MSGAIVPIIASIAAVAAKKKREQEEEGMVLYKSGDLDGWEFKIVRSTWGRFSSHKVIEELCRRESMAGWEMVEKFDDHRIRFKRRTEKRSQDVALGVDPYRSNLGAGSETKILVILAVVLMLAGMVLFLRF